MRDVRRNHPVVVLGASKVCFVVSARSVGSIVDDVTAPSQGCEYCSVVTMSGTTVSEIPEPAGMIAMLDPESAAIITTALDTALSPRRGGPTFVDPIEQARAKSQQADPRTTEQLAVDTLVDIVVLATRAAGATGPELAKIFGVNSPAVRVHVTAETLTTGIGAGWIEGQDAGISAHTAARYVCTSGVLPVLFDGVASIDVARWS